MRSSCGNGALKSAGAVGRVGRGGSRGGDAREAVMIYMKD